MDSKQILEDAQPPPYSVHDVANASNTQEQTSITSHLQNQFSFLPNRIRMRQEAHSAQQSLDDSSLLDYIVPEIEAFLTNLSNVYPIPKLAYLKLVPAAAVPPHASLSGIDDMRQRGEYCQVVRIDTSPMGDKNKRPDDHDHSSKSSDLQDWSRENEFDDWGRFSISGPSNSTESSRELLWWKDEDMARRLASHLRPATTRNEPPVLQTPVQAVVEQRLPAQKEDKPKWPWQRKSSVHNAAKAAEVEAKRFQGQNKATPSKARPEGRGGARMSIEAEELAFRVENAFGIMESICGWAVVLTMRVTT